MKPTIYEGMKFNNHATVTKKEPSNSKYLLPTYTHVRNHGSKEFDWGGFGSGTSQLAFALIYDITKDEELSLQLYQEFKRKVLVTLPNTYWKMTSTKIKAELRKIWSTIHGKSK